MSTLDLRAHHVGELGVTDPAARLEPMRAVIDEVDVPGEVPRAADGHGDRDRLAVEGVAQRVDRRLVRRVLLVHLVDDDQGRQVARRDHLPGELGADGHAATGSDDEHHRVGSGERRGELPGEVLEAGHIDEVDAVPVPVEVRQRRADAHRAGAAPRARGRGSRCPVPSSPYEESRPPRGGAPRTASSCRHGCGRRPRPTGSDQGLESAWAELRRRWLTRAW